MAGDLAAATTSLTRALELYRDVGDRHGEAEALNDLGDLLSSSSTVADARSKHESALTTARIINAPLEEARALEGIGNCYLKQGKMDEGSEHLRQALTIYRAIKSPNSGRVETILQDHGH
jgi:tetratricopeptide (TPR) repeat protein